MILEVASMPVLEEHVLDECIIVEAETEPKPPGITISQVVRFSSYSFRPGLTIVTTITRDRPGQSAFPASISGFFVFVAGGLHNASGVILIIRYSTGLALLAMEAVLCNIYTACTCRQESLTTWIVGYFTALLYMLRLDSDAHHARLSTYWLVI
ncbi:hypothetical protein Hypma_004591 [Hypsizygus marmoreus]|uniref:Uncharacterized protein n=1 Tax=Hypsizygus marmoreus TaxID=39966 RepID=A0A369K0Y8_HYPMA|nr:hypothetical protein Hypma_004591 [Hypsizygus marmoreus]